MTVAGSLALDAVVVTITNPGQAPQTVNVDSAAAAASGALSAVDALVWEWSRTTPRDHLNAGSLELVLQFLAPRVIALDALVSVVVTAAGQTVTLPGHWVESVTWSRRVRDVAPVWVYRVVAVNGVARADGDRLAALPWPAGDTFTQRLERINAASRLAPVDIPQTVANLAPYATEAYSYAARDVDAAPAREVIERTANTRGLLAAASPAGVCLYRQDANQMTFYGSAYALHVAPAPTPLPADAIEDTPRTLSRRGVVTRASVSWFEPDPITGDPDEATRTWLAAGAQPAASVSYPTDHLGTLASLESRPIAATASALVADPTPVPILESARVMLDRAPALLAALVEPVTSQATQWWLDGAPDDLEPAVAVTAGTLTVAGGRLALVVELQPLALTGTRATRWGDWPDPTTLPPGSPYVPITFGHLAATGLPDPVYGGTDPTGPVRVRHTAVMFRPRFWQ